MHNSSFACDCSHDTCPPLGMRSLDDPQGCVPFRTLYPRLSGSIVFLPFHPPPPIQAYNYGITPISEERTLQEMGFDYTYDKGVLDRLKASGEEGRRGSGIQGHVR